MKRVPVMAVLFAGAGFLAGAVGCMGPTPQTNDGGFVAGSAGSYGSGYGTAGTYGSAGTYGTGGTAGTYGTGGTSAGDNPKGETADGGDGEEEPGGGGRRRDTGPDAGPLSACAAGTMAGATCHMADLTCMLSAGDAGRAAICTCRTRGGAGTWRCYTP
jgi:hypothetical protein